MSDREPYFPGLEYTDVAALVAGMSGEELAKFFAILNDTDRAALLRGVCVCVCVRMYVCGCVCVCVFGCM